MARTYLGIRLPLNLSRLQLTALLQAHQLSFDALHEELALLVKAEASATLILQLLVKDFQELRLGQEEEHADPMPEIDLLVKILQALIKEYPQRGELTRVYLELPATALLEYTHA